MEDQSQIEAFVGKNSDYYIQKWSRIGAGGGDRLSWNWAAAIGGIAWMLYRKLYTTAIIVFAVIFVDAWITVILEESQVFPIAVAIWDRFSYILYLVVFGWWGNYWYFRRYQRIADLSEREMQSPTDDHGIFAEKGGTNIWAPGLFLLAIGALLVWAYS
jgi:hypothetical protein